MGAINNKSCGFTQVHTRVGRCHPYFAVIAAPHMCFSAAPKEISSASLDNCKLVKKTRQTKSNHREWVHLLAASESGGTMLTVARQ
jgi:hypothetical protein